MTKNLQAAIYIEENHHFTVGLGALSYTDWEKGSGTVEAKIPYDGFRFKEEVISQAETFHVGELQITMPNESEPISETMPIEIAAGERWQHHLKSAKRAVCRGKYDLNPPEQTLISVQGEVLDIPLADNEKRFINPNPGLFQNPLQFHMKLWLPDLTGAVIEDEADQINQLILHREHAQQIFMRSGQDLAQQLGINTKQGFSYQLAQNMVALANSYGGTILIGVGKKGEMGGISSAQAAEMPTHLLNALFKTTPLVPIQQAALYMVKGKKIYLLKIPSPESGTIYRVNGEVYKREKLKNIHISSPTEKEATQPQITIKSLDELLMTDESGEFTLRNSADVAVINGATGINNLELGIIISGMINANLNEAIIVVHNIPLGTTGALSRQNVRKQIENHLRKELRHITPAVPEGIVNLTPVKDTLFAIISVPIGNMSAALYKREHVFVWENQQPQSKTPELLLKRLLSGRHSNDKGQNPVQLEKASVSWRVRPPEKAKPHANYAREVRGQTAVYNVQHQSLAWQSVSINKNDATSGYETTLSLPLNNVAVGLDESGAIFHQAPVIEGKIEICLNDTLISGIELTVVEEADNGGDSVQEKSYLQQLPILKRTLLHLDFKADLSQIFKHRRPKGSFLEFFVEDTLVDMDRAKDIIQACADIGFRIYELFPQKPISELLVQKATHLDDGRYIISKGYFEGIRSNKFFDIHLLVGWDSQLSQVTRQLRYEDVRDVSTSNTSNLACRVYMEGKGEGVRHEISRLQMRLYELIKRRLQQSGAE